ncbi:hypothetical protein [Streptomyces sp. DG1A-41]|uniref:hypothetical protein n=1 Tax=Streptomyces sp. DG1A-41 TaxID=3125779 RepID=UPI0030CEFC27
MARTSPDATQKAFRAPAGAALSCAGAPDVVVWKKALPSRATTMVPPSPHLDQVARTLTGHHELAYVAAATGSINLIAEALCPDPTALHGHLIEKVGAVEADAQPGEPPPFWAWSRQSARSRPWPGPARAAAPGPVTPSAG